MQRLRIVTVPRRAQPSVSNSQGPIKRTLSSRAGLDQLSPKAKRWLRLALAAVWAALLVPAVQVGCVGLVNPPTTSPMVLRWLGGKVAGKAQAPNRYEWIALKEVPGSLLTCVWVSEDNRFFQHWGFDWDEIRNAQAEARASGRPSRGASTITQQCARALFLWQRRSWLRKGLEAYYTVWMELLLSKQRILELYVNVIEMGDGVYGIEAGAEHHYGIHAGELTFEQAAMLVAILPKPRDWDPNQPNERVLGRQAIIMQRSARAHLPREGEQ
jgi:monofunctional glycosyltransferase